MITYLLGFMLVVILIGIYNRSDDKPLSLRVALVAGLFSWFGVVIVGFTILYIMWDPVYRKERGLSNISMIYDKFVAFSNTYNTIDTFFRGTKTKI